MTVYSTLIMELWKRKNNEICSRWGMLDYMNSDNKVQAIRNEYIAGEEIDKITG